MRSRCLVLLVGFALALPARGACVLPPAPSKVPDAASATQEEMLLAMQTLKRYANDVNSYLKCVEFEANQNRLTRDEETRLHNSALDALQAITVKFNEQVRLFKSRKH